MRTCSLCRISKPTSSFYAPSNSSRHPSRYCIPCHRAKGIEYSKSYIQPPAYGIWINLRRRCYNKKKGYGDRGITYTPKWDTYKGFWEDMGASYEKGLSIDRIDNNGNYSKENCRWATPVQQVRNRRNTRTATINGVTKSFAEWCEQYGLAYNSARDYLYRGYSPEEAITLSLEKKTK